MTDDNLEQRLTNIENAIERLAHYIAGGHPSSHKAEINKEDFTRLYNNVKYTIPITSRFSPLVMFLNEKYKESLLKDTLKPSDLYAGYYEPIGEISPVLISFARLKNDYDYSVDFELNGFFEWDRPQPITDKCNG